MHLLVFERQFTLHKFREEHFAITVTEAQVGEIRRELVRIEEMCFARAALPTLLEFSDDLVTPGKELGRTFLPVLKPAVFNRMVCQLAVFADFVCAAALLYPARCARARRAGRASRREQGS